MNTDPRIVYRDVAANNAGPVRLVVLLYEQLVEDLRRALAAAAADDTEQRTAELNHALDVLGQLQGRLDLENGGEVAQNLESFYYHLRSSLFEAHVKKSTHILQQQINHLLSIREAWLEVERAAAAPNSQPPSTPDSPPAASQHGDLPNSSDWTA